jgi:protein-L-isoaspartate O-methyltransferase
VGPVLDQNFVRIVRSADGARFTETKLFSVRYVPLTTAAAQLQRM